MKKQIFYHVSGINPATSTVSSMGTFVTNQQQQLADERISEIMSAIPEGTLAHKILMGTQTRFSEKQIWVITFELLKNEAKCNEIVAYYDEIEAAERRRREFKRAAKAAKKSGETKLISNIGARENKTANVDPCADLNVGDTVSHKSFGEGEIIAIDDKVVTVNFSGIEKKLLRAYSRLEKVS